MTDRESDDGSGGTDRERDVEPAETTGKSGHTRRGLLAALGAAGSAASTGCLGLLGLGDASTDTETPSPTPTDYPTPSPSPSPDPVPTETPTLSPMATPESTPTPTSSPTPSVEDVWADDFEDGSLSEYAVRHVAGDDDTEGYEVVSQPSIGEYAVRHRTESRVIHPADPVAIDPPVTAYFDVYVSGWSGVDFLLQRNPEAGAFYRVDVRINANGRFVRVAKAEGEDHRNLEKTKSDTVGKDGDPGVLRPRHWERIGVRWSDDGVEAAALGSERWVSITDSDDRLRGNDIGLVGYHYGGWAAFDNLVVRRGAGPIPRRDEDRTATPDE